MGIQLHNAYEQCIELPRAIATSDGQLNKGTKANTTTVYEKRYQCTPPIITTSYPLGWVPSTVVMEGMFLINILPWSAHSSMGEYADFLLKQHILPHFRNGAQEVHLLFDDPDCQIMSPKFFERMSRDKNNPVPDNHSCSKFTSSMLTLPKWQKDVLSCRKCKRSLVCFLLEYFIEQIRQRLLPGQRFVTAGGFTGSLQNQAIFTEFNVPLQPDSSLTCNTKESDSRIWLHVLNSAGEKKLMLSPDIDVYNIGLPLIANTNLDIIVRLSQFTSKELCLLHMKELIHAFTNDPDLATIPQQQIPSTMQTLYVCTGCDFISFFHGLGKAYFLNSLFEYSDFICSNSDQIPGTLAQPESEQSLLSFFRLVGCTYFRKHKAAFLPMYPTPMSVFHSLSRDKQTPLAHHNTWLQFLRERVWSRIKYEEEMIPSDDALERHWKRSCWVLAVWKQANDNNINYPPLNGNGWKQTDSELLQIDWDSDFNICKVCTRVALIRKGCGCKTGCMTNRCKCRKSGNHCGPGCACLSCCNLPAKTNPEQVEVEVAETVNPDSDQSDSDLEAEVDDIMYHVFGDFESADKASECDDTDSCSSNSDTEAEISDDDMDVDSCNL